MRTRLLRFVALLAFSLMPAPSLDQLPECSYVFMFCTTCYRNQCWCSSYSYVGAFGGTNTYYNCNTTITECESCGTTGPCWWIDATIHSWCGDFGYHHTAYLCCDQY